MSEYPLISLDVPTSATLPDVPRHVTSDLSTVHALEQEIADLKARVARLERPNKPGRPVYPQLPRKRY